MAFRDSTSGIFTLLLDAGQDIVIPRPDAEDGDVIYTCIAVVGNYGSMPIASPPSGWVTEGAADLISNNGAVVTGAMRMYSHPVGAAEGTDDTWTLTSALPTGPGTSAVYCSASFELSGAFVGGSDTFGTSTGAPTYTDDEYAAGTNGAMAGLDVGVVYGLLGSDNDHVNAGSEQDWDDPTLGGSETKTLREEQYTGNVFYNGNRNVALKLWLYTSEFTADGSGTQEQVSIGYDADHGGFIARRHYFWPNAPAPVPDVTHSAPLELPQTRLNLKVFPNRTGTVNLEGMDAK